jgi:hypothetical protein
VGAELGVRDSGNRGRYRIRNCRLMLSRRAGGDENRLSSRVFLSKKSEVALNAIGEAGMAKVIVLELQAPKLPYKIS